MEEVDEVDQVVARVAALDLGKASLVACVRVPHPDKSGKRCQEIRTYDTFSGSLFGIGGLAAV